MASLRQSFELSSFNGTPEKVLVIDDVATFGDTFLVAKEKILARLPWVGGEITYIYTRLPNWWR
jgi:hypothetical protein